MIPKLPTPFRPQIAIGRVAGFAMVVLVLVVASFGIGTEASMADSVP